MRKLSSIFLLLVLCFNLFGYRFVVSAMKQQADSRLDQRLDEKEYNESELIEFSVSLNMPYQERFTDFERHYGKVEIDGIAYTYVARKIQGDVVTFRCIPNKSRQAIEEFDQQLIGSNAGTSPASNPTQKQAVSFAKIFFGELYDQFQINLSVPQTHRILSYTSYSESILNLSLGSPDQPPKS